MLFNEPKLLKLCYERRIRHLSDVSVLFNEPKLLKWRIDIQITYPVAVSVLFNEPKLLKSPLLRSLPHLVTRFSALQRAEIAEIALRGGWVRW